MIMYTFRLPPLHLATEYSMGHHENLIFSMEKNSSSELTVSVISC